MSAIRTTNNRRARSRSAQSPYARPPAKKSTWSLTGFLSYLNPLRSRSPVDFSGSQSSLDDDDSAEESFGSESSHGAQSLSARGQQMMQDIGVYDRPNAVAGPFSQLANPSLPPLRAPPQTPPSQSIGFGEHPSPEKAFDDIGKFISDRVGKPITSLEMEGLRSILRQSIPPEQPEPFRFSSTPFRGNTPFQANTDTFTFGLNTSAAPVSTPSPRKTLSRNPNGIYRWEGGGSAKLARSRNRYSSPAFGPSRSTGDRIILKEGDSVKESPKADTKRRRVGEEADSSLASPSGSNINGDAKKAPFRSSAPDPSPTRTTQAHSLPFPVSNGSPTPLRPPNGSSKSGGAPSLSRLRVPALPPKPTVPAVPSPLRQAWSGGSGSSSDSPPSQSKTPQKQTKAANFMAQLIKEVTPPKKPDLSNPYQTASPVGKVAVTTKSRIGKRTRATGKPLVPAVKNDKGKEKTEVVKEKAYSPQAIIEATLPKGSKRSKPPAHFEKAPPSASPEIPPSSSNMESSGSAKLAAYVVEEADDGDDDENKRVSKKVKPYLNGRGMASTRKSPSPSPSPGIMIVEEVDKNAKNATVEKAQTTTAPHEGPSVSSSGSGATSPSKTTGRSVFPGFKTTSTPKEPSKLRYSYQPEAGGSTALSPPASAPAPAIPSAPATVSENTTSKRVQFAQPTKTEALPPKEAALVIPVHALPSFIFSVSTNTQRVPLQYSKAREEAKQLAKSALPSFDFKTAPSVNVAPPVKAFDWAAAGMKPAGDGANWTCSTCMLSNPATAIDKCTICDAQR